MPYSESRIDGNFYGGQNQALGLRVGCLLCTNNFEIDCSAEGAQQIRDLTEGDVPVSSASRQPEAGGCGLDALNGACKNLESLTLVREMIGAGDIQGVFIR